MKHNDFENIVGFELPKKIKYIDGNGPARTHYAFLKNERTGALLAYAEEKRICMPTTDNVRNKYHAEQLLVNNIEKVRNRYSASEWRGTKTIISARFSKYGFIGNSKFCLSCAKLLLKKCGSYVNYVSYFEDGYIHKKPLENVCDNAHYSTNLLFRKNLSTNA